MSMSCNVGSLDRIVRLVVAAGLVGTAALGVLSGWAAGVALVVAGVLAVTAVVRFCPLYALLRIRTCPAEGR
jgi:hypothetical protein